MHEMWYIANTNPTFEIKQKNKKIKIILSTINQQAFFSFFLAINLHPSLFYIFVLKSLAKIKNIKLN